MWSGLSHLFFLSLEYGGGRGRGTGENHLFPLPLLLCGAGRQNENSDSFLTGCLPVAWRSYVPCVPQSLYVETFTTHVTAFEDKAFRR